MNKLLYFDSYFWNFQLWHHFQRPLIGGPNWEDQPITNHHHHEIWTYTSPKHISAYTLKNLYKSLLSSVLSLVYNFGLKRPLSPTTTEPSQKKNSFDIFFHEKPAEETSSETSSKNRSSIKSSKRAVVLYGSCTSKSLISWISKSNR